MSGTGYREITQSARRTLLGMLAVQKTGTVVGRYVIGLEAMVGRSKRKETNMIYQNEIKYNMLF
jgi:hypothetical protein